MSSAVCSHCLLPVRAHAHEREVNGEAYQFCCYGCALAFQVHHGQHEEADAAWLLIRLGAGAFLAMNIMLFSLVLYSGSLGPADGQLAWRIHVLLWALATPILVILGGPFFKGAWQAARNGQATADTLVSLGAIAAYGYSVLEVVTGGAAVYFDTATMVLVLFTLGRYLEAIGRGRAARSLAPMLAAERACATVIVNGRDSERPVREISPGTTVRVRPGERVPVDGVVIEGRSQCDEAVLTGQSDPVIKFPDSVVYAGSINSTGQLLIRTTVAGPATRWGKMSRLVREALSHKGLLGELVDQVAAVFVPAVVILAAGTILYWSSQGSFEQALMAGLAVLVVACPCALGLAASLATALGLGLAAEQGVLIRSGGVLERLARVKAVAFDKTGTLTSGQVRMTGALTDGVPETELLRRAAGVEQGSEHPLARGIVAAAHAGGLAPETVPNVHALPGQGVVGGDGDRLTAVGNARLMATLGWTIPPALAARARERSAEGHETIAYVGWSGRVWGLLRLSDTPLPEAKAVVKRTRELGLKTLLLSGDAPTVVKSVAVALGFDAWQGGMSPEEKLAALEARSEEEGLIAMVGDGLNDGPVLAAAGVGVAVGGAADLARESADITLPEGALQRLPWLIQHARKVHKAIRMNIVWALGYNLVALFLAAAGLLQPVIAAGLMAGSSLVVVINSLHVGKEQYPGPVTKPGPATAMCKD
ncbi:MAG: heavy metal translocating P-type ATPase [Rhodospirillales bacterium]|nr:heavy metal translocating P-type ATPase [Rhodospirillales bacterium]